MTADKIYLVGFMASGKSTVARALAHRLRWRARISTISSKRANGARSRTSSRGEASRTSGASSAKSCALLQPMRHVVVATGGGTFADPENRATINFDGVSVWIDVPLSDLIPRIPLDGRRPLAADRAAARAAVCGAGRGRIAWRMSG